MNNIVLNIPYSSKELPSFFFDSVCLEKNLVDQFNIYQTENFVDRIFGKNTYPKIIAPYSKIYCDVLNLKHLEDSNNFDFILTKTNKGRVLIKPTEEYKNKVTNEYYKPLHNRIEQSLTKLCNKGKTIFIDCHSHTARNFEANQKPVDVLISVSEKYSKSSMNNFIVKYFEQHGYTVDFNNIHKGTFIPNSFLKSNNNNLSAVRISINQNLYLTLGEPNQHFKKVQKDVQNLLKFLKNLDFEG